MKGEEAPSTYENLGFSPTGNPRTNPTNQSLQRCIDRFVGYFRKTRYPNSTHKTYAQVVKETPQADEDIAMLDTTMPWSSPTYKSSPTWSSRSSRIQPAPLHGFGDFSLIRRPNEVILDALES